jgi:ribonuclease HI
MRRPPKQNQKERQINIYSLNTARTNAVAHHSLQIAATHPHKFDIVLHQEPWWGNISARDDAMGEARAAGWNVLLPVTIPQGEPLRPRVLTYFRQGTDLEIVQRTDIIQNHDIQILDIKRPGTLQRTIRLINIYNAPEGSEHFATDSLTALQLDHNIPTIITGDWNLKHPRIGEMTRGRNPTARAVKTMEWLDANGYEIQNEWNQETWCKYGETCTSALDLTFQNNRAAGLNIIQNWEVARNINAGSDHYATTFTIGGGEDELTDLTEAKYNWKATDEKRYTEELRRLLEKDRARHAETFDPIRTGDGSMTTQQVDNATAYILKLMTAAADIAVPRRRPSARAKPWWTQELSNIHTQLTEARANASALYKVNGRPNTEAARLVKHLANKTERLIKKTKQNFYENAVKSVGPRNFWDLKKWTMGSRQYPSPPIDRGEGTAPALTHEDKCNTIRAHLLPRPAAIPNEPEIDLEPHQDDMPWTPLTKNEVRAAIFCGKPNNAPGYSGMTGKAYRLAWPIIGEEIHWTLRAAANLGYHPEMFRKSICVVLRKPKKNNYSKPNAYRPIQLLEVLGKALERIQSDRFEFLATKNNMIPPLHFGGMKGKSAEDAVLCATHDIHEARNHGLATSTLTFDISGFFNNVNHAVLLHKLRKLHFPLTMVKWVASFLSNRQTAMCLDGKRGPLEDTHTGVPQGSPVSGILTTIYTASLTKHIQDGMKEVLENNMELAQEIKRNRGTQTVTIIYVDDGKLTLASTNIKTNTKVLAEAFRLVEGWMSAHGLTTDVVKRELLHHSWRHNDYKRVDGEIPAIETPISIEATAQQPELVIPASKTIKWLGITFDNKLSFNAHLKRVTENALKALNALNMLGNSIRGLHQVFRRHIVQGAILPMALYASPAWWDGRKQKANIIEKIQNKALRWITGAFRTTPTASMQVEASIPPIDITLDYINSRKAAAIHHFPDHHPVKQRYPPTLRNRTPDQEDGIMIQTPHRPIGARTLPTNRAGRELKNAKCTPIYSIAQLTTEGVEQINRLPEPPWHRVDERVTIKIPPNEAGKTMKKRWAQQHKKRMRSLEENGDMIVYTDGSLYHIRGTRHTGAATLGFQRGEAIFQEAWALGNKVEVYDAEMDGLARGAELAREWLHARGNGHGAKRIWFFADNTGAIQRIYKATPGYDQEQSWRFRTTIHHILDAYPDMRVNIEWVPGHQNITGNETADQLAKQGAMKTPDNPHYSSAAFDINARRQHTREQWIHRWQSRPITHRSDFHTADRIPPTTRPTRRFKTLDRKLFSRSIQCRTGHAHIGSYYEYFNIEEPYRCACGTFETRNHIILDCVKYETHRPNLGNKHGVLEIRELLGTPGGILRLAAFIAATKAFDKPPQTTTPHTPPYPP